MFKIFGAVALMALVSCDSSSGTNANGADSSNSGNSSPGASSGSTAVTEALVNHQDCGLNAEQTALACSEKTYKVVKIGSNLWFAENLNVGTASQGKFCYNDKPSNCDTYGGLYDWNVAMALPDSCRLKECVDITGYPIHQGICPNGWHISNSDDFGDLAEALGGKDVAGKAMKANSSEWLDWNNSSANDGNSSGFSALPAMYRTEDGDYATTIAVTSFWLPSEIWGDRAFGEGLHQSTLSLDADYNSKNSANSVRCVKNQPTP